MKFIDLKIQYQRYRNEINQEIASVSDRASFILGPTLHEFEEKLALYSGVEHAIGCSSGTDALLLALMALDIQPGDEIITTPYTFIATAEVIAFLKAKPVFVDVEANTYNVDPNLIEVAITSKTKAIIPVSLFGEVANLTKINKIAHKYNLPVIEDAAQSYGANYYGKKSTNLSSIGITSFFPTKPLGGHGDGGAVFTNDVNLAKKIRILLNHGQDKRYHHSYIGINGRLDDIQAAVLKVKIKYLDEEIERRTKIAQYYDRHIDLNLFSVQKTNSQCNSAYALYSITLNLSNLSREKILEHLNTKNIPTGVYYPIPLHLQKVFSNLGYRQGDLPVAEKISKIMFSIPVHPFLTKEEITSVVSALNSFNTK